MAARVARDHHEFRDGSGYMRGVKLNDPMVEIVAVCDIYDGLLSPRPYRTAAYDNRTALEEYQKALIFETLKAEAKTVREIAAQTGLPVYTVSLRLNDLERTGLAAYLDQVGNSPRFGATAE